MTDKPPCEEDMTDLTDEAVKALLDGATPGRRVQFHGSYCPEAVGTPFTDWDTSHDMSVIRPDGSRYRLAHYKHASDAYLSQMAPDLARALLDARAELARVKADAAVAVAEAIRRAAENKEQLDIWAQEILEGLSFADVLKITSYDDKIEAHNMVGRGLVDVILNLAPADGLAAVEALRERAEKAEQERDAAVRGRNDWRDDFKALAAAIVGDTGLSAMTVAAQARTFRPRAEKAEADRDRLASEADALVAAALEPVMDLLMEPVATHTDSDWLDRRHDLLVQVTSAPAAAALDKLIAEAVKAETERCAQIGGDAAVEVLLRHEPDASPLKIQMTRQAIANPIRRAANGETK